MSKRTLEVISDALHTKRHRVTAASIEETPDDTNHEGPSPSSFSLSATGDIGLIESVTLKNFMCHSFLGPVQFGPNVNFIVGNNGSGKSAILTALIIGLGGKATITNRGLSLKDFVKTGEKTAEITINLRNRGPDAYKGNVYGNCISIEHRLYCDGSRICKLKSKSGQLITTKRKELAAILDHFNIQLDNPVSILSQEMSKQFLHSKSEADKYKFFMKATHLDQMKTDYSHIKQTQSVTRQQVEEMEKCLKNLKQDSLQKKARYENLLPVRDMRVSLENLKKTMAWCLVTEKEQFVQQLKEDIEEEEEKNYQHQNNLQLCQTKITQIKTKLQDVTNTIRSLTKQQESLTEDCLDLKEKLKIIDKALRMKELVHLRALNKLKRSKQEQNLLQDKINKAKISLSQNSDGEPEYTKQQEEICSLKEQLAELENELSQLNQEIESKQQALLSVKEERDKLRLEEKNLQLSYESNLSRRNQLVTSRSNKLKRFGENTPDLLNSISEANAKGLFLKRPLGPIGACISLKDPELAFAVECCLQNYMKSFCCDNYEDEAVLQELMSHHYSDSNRPKIIVSPFSDRVYNVDRWKAYHPEFPSVLDMITESNPAIINCLIDMRGIESVLIIKDKDKARRVMQQGQRPINCKEAFTANGDHVFPNRYYTRDSSTIRYLSGDLETEISELESELENQQAQLSRFQLHLTSVCDEILSMENALNSIIMTLRKKRASTNQIKASITQLETAGEEQIADVSALEKVAQENCQKIEAERQAVCKAEMERDEWQKKVKDKESEYFSLRRQADQILDDMDPVKAEQEKLEIASSRQKQNLKILESQLRAHEDNIRAMKSDLAQRQEELQEYVAKASQISPERQQVTASAKSIDAQITRLEQKIRVFESSHGEEGQLLREYAEALTLYRQKTNQLTDLRKFINRLGEIISDRKDRYKVMQRSLSSRCRLYFTNFLIKMNWTGSMIFDHINETLSISVGPPGGQEDHVSDTRSLSGGERSLSTICFMLALWEITESPFRCLDEFDVCMDMQCRRMSLDLLLDLSQRQKLRQFIFITPLATSYLPKTSFIKIHQLQEPERQDEDVSSET